MKTIRLTAVLFEMLQELSKKDRMKPEQYLDKVIKGLYQQTFK
jgi:hypothetical protein